MESTTVSRSQSTRTDALPGIKHLVAVASAKGGVGKSTVAVNLALSLVRLGLKVGIVDADILGPSVPGMLGLSFGEPPVMRDGLIIPDDRHGLAVISMGMLTDDDTPAVLRGPMVSKYIQLFFTGVSWGERDFLIIDLPPGTGDTQLTLAQRMPLTGAVIVTTPQDVSLKIARRGLRMFERVQVPILGVIENMSGFACPECGTTTDIFRTGGGARLSQEVGVRFLGKVPIDVGVVQSGDAGVPIVVSQPEAAVSRAYFGLADKLVGSVDAAAALILPHFDWRWDDPDTAPPWITTAVRKAQGHADVPVGLRRADARTMAVLWQDGAQHEIDVRDLRLACPCAHCVEEMSGRPLLDPTGVPTDVTPIRIASVGRYAMAIHWSDGHNTGIYAFDRLRELVESAPFRQEVAV